MARSLTDGLVSGTAREFLAQSRILDEVKSSAKSGTSARVLIGLVGVLGLALLNVALPAQASAPVDATNALPPTGAGIDISFPQCAATSHVDLPAGIPFAIVGINGGSANNDNPCLQSEYNSALLLAGTTGQPHASVYVNTGNPALAGAWWPTGDTAQDGAPVANPDGTCEHRAGSACAYVYGYSMARADYQRAVDRLTRVPNLWWLDVETTNTWQADLPANSASLSGMVDYFQSKGLTVGIYSTSLQWKKIAGVTPSTSHLAGLLSWLAGGTYVGAPKDCQKPPLTPGGRVAMIQFVTHLDNDYSCAEFSAASAAIAAPVPPVAGSTLVATASNWGPGVSYSYQWDRNNVIIPDATSSTYTTTSKDTDANITVTITGMKLGYGTTPKTSPPVAILGQLTPATPRLSGTFTSGHTLTVTPGTWRPAPVSFTYTWYRDGAQVASGTTATTYSLTAQDVGHYITVAVTGTENNYATLTLSAMSPLIAS